MKRIIFFLCCIFSSLSVLAGDGEEYITLKSGFLFPQTGNAQIAYERGIDYDAYVELFGEIGSKLLRTEQGKDFYWAGGIGYKRGIKRYKNSTLSLSGEIHAGAYIKEFFFGAGLGLEYAYTFRSGLQIVIQQKNQVNFLYNDTFKNGILIGLRVPL